MYSNNGLWIGFHAKKEDLMDPTLKQTNDSWKRNISFFLISQQCSIFGSSVASFAVIWYITLETSSGIAITAVTIASFLPQIITSLFAGVWADRYNRKLLIIVPDLFIAASTFVLVVLFWLGIQSIFMLIVISAVRSFGSGVQMPSVMAIVPQIVPADKLVRINGINSTLNSVLLLASPAVAGMLLGGLGIEFALLADVVTALLAVVFMNFLRLPPKNPASLPDNTGAIRDILDGLRYTRSHPFLLRLMIVYAVVFILITPAAFLTPLYVERTFGPEVWRLTLNEITWTAGMLLGGIYVAVKGTFKNKFFVMFICTAAFGVTFGLLGIAQNFAVYLIILVIAGLFMPAYSAADTVLIQENVAEHMMGRVFSLVQIIASISMPLGMLFFGPLSDLISMDLILMGSGLLLLLSSPLILGCRLSKEENE
jgi:MFS transporter, DHA3 family, macrolide efflux protein